MGDKPLLHVYVPFIAKQRNDDGTITVTGKVAGPDLDGDQQIMNEEWLAGALPQWFNTGANVREQHQQIAAGVGSQLSQVGQDWHLKSTIVDPVTISKIEHKVLNGYSAGIRNGKVLMKSARAPRGEIVGGDIVEVSVVDRGANPTCRFTFAKAADSGELVDLEAPEYVVFDEATKSWVPDPEAGDIKSEAELNKAGNPFADKGDKKETITDAASFKAAVKAAMKLPVAMRKSSISHIKARAKALKLEVPASLDKLATADIIKADELPLIQDALQSIAALIVAEAEELAKGEDERSDISQLLNAVYALWCFWEHEASTGEVPAPDEMETDEMGDINLSAVVDLVKAASADDANDDDKAVLTDLRKALGLDGEFISKADFEAAQTKWDEDRTALTTQVQELGKSAAPGGPIKTRTTEDTSRASERELHIAKAEQLEKSASTVTDRNLAEGFTSMARAERQAADLLLK